MRIHEVIEACIDHVALDGVLGRSGLLEWRSNFSLPSHPQKDALGGRVEARSDPLSSGGGPLLINRIRRSVSTTAPRLGRPNARRCFLRLHLHHPL